MLGGKRRQKQQQQASGETRESSGIFGRLFSRNTRSTQPLERSGRQENYSKRGRSQRPVGLTPVVTPRADGSQPSNDEGESSSSEDHLTELEQEEKKQEPRAPGQKHFPDDLLMGRYTFTRYLGHGSYGHVCEGVETESEKKVAIKKVDRVFENLIDAKRLLREMSILRILRDHQSIVDLIDLVPPLDAYTFDHITFVFEFVDTDLSRLIASDQNFTTLHVQYMMYQILLGMKYMHTAGIAHRDLKPANILVNEDCTLKICDFGLSRGINENQEQQDTQNESDAAAAAGDQPAANGSSSASSRKQFLKQKQRKKKPKREVTRHVVTRWYRAPEVILLQQQRILLPAVDMWSIGCIMAELMQMKRENGVGHRERKPLFPGTSCFPLSARDPFAYADRMDQLNVIFDHIGTPSDDDIGKLTDEKAKKYLRQLPRRAAMDLRTKFPGSDDEERDLLQKFIIFDPEHRLTVEEALEHPYFAKVRDVNAERVHEAQRFDFEDIPLSKEELKILIIQEIGFFNPEWMNGDGQAAIERLQGDIERKGRRGGRR